MLSIEQFRTAAEAELVNAAEGDNLDALSRALIDLAVKASVTALDVRALDEAMSSALDTGASPTQIQEIISLASGLGVHSLMVSA